MLRQRQSPRCPPLLWGIQPTPFAMFGFVLAFLAKDQGIPSRRWELSRPNYGEAGVPDAPAAVFSATLATISLISAAARESSRAKFFRSPALKVPPVAAALLEECFPFLALLACANVPIGKKSLRRCDAFCCCLCLFALCTAVVCINFRGKSGVQSVLSVPFLVWSA